MRVPRSATCVVTTLGFLLHATGLAHAAEGSDRQPAPASPSLAPVDATSDVVFLTDGGMVRGMVVEALPGDHVTIRLPTGQTDVIVWARVDRIERAPLAPIAPAPAAVPVAPPPATAMVHVDAEPGVVLKWNSRTGPNGIGQCTAPCDAALPLHATYFLAGEEIRSSPAFNLEASPGQHVVIHASTASRAGFNGGIAVLSIGGAGVITGLTMLLLGAYGIGNCADGFLFPYCSANGGLEVAGAGVALGGCRGRAGWRRDLRLQPPHERDPNGLGLPRFSAEGRRDGVASICACLARLGASLGRSIAADGVPGFVTWLLRSVSAAALALPS